ncbi:hypothetical protein SH1V18_03400 [Vallitalea longa]|uniref:Uncharacterized protein n=1 Tax=Vallitalea longa TaxID=2936439 RepID=A0A9W5Y8F0_9FIRM|nr:hypothetical protein [Vallitalea longa]GKX27860.1 hypothetical protein SH1V18_03400 [Vallitalea longa]
MNIIQEYTRVVEAIAVANSQLISAKRELQKIMNTYRPPEIKGLNYDQEKVQVSTRQQNIMITANNICILTNYINELKAELEELNEQRRDLENTINSLGDVKKQYIMYKMKDPKMPNWKIANKAHVSLSTLKRNIKDV